MRQSGRSSVIAVVVVLLLVVTAGVFFARAPRHTEQPAEPERTLNSDANALTQLVISTTGDSFAAASAEGQVLVFSLPGGREKTVGQATEYPVTMLSWSPDGLLLCGDSSGLLRGWKQPDLKESKIDSPRVPVTCTVFRKRLNRREILLGLVDGRIVTIGQKETTLRDSGHRGVKDMLLSDDQNTMITAGTEGTIIWYDLRQDRVLSEEKQHDTEIAALTWSPDKKSVISADWNGQIHLWNAASRKLTASATQPDAVSGLAWAGEQLVTGGWDGRLRVWNVSMDQLDLARSIYTGRPIHSLIAVPSESVVFTASGDSSIRQWNVSADSPTKTRGIPARSASE